MKEYNITDPVILTGQYWPHVEACYSQTWEQYDMPPHFHNRVEIMYVLKGSGLVHLYDYQVNPTSRGVRVTGRRVEQLGPGEFILLEQGLMHKLEVPQTSYMLNVEFRIVEDARALLSLAALARASADFAAMLNRRQPLLRGRDDTGHLLRALEQAIAEFSNSVAASRALADVLMAELLLRTAECARSPHLKSSAFNYAQQAADYISAHLDGEIRVDEVARQVGIAPAYLQRVFRQAMGDTLIGYANRLRVEQSKRLLMYTADPIVDVAIASGFNSRQHFFRIFNAVTGVSPQQYRREHRTQRAQPVFLFDDVINYSMDGEGPAPQP